LKRAAQSRERAKSTARTAPGPYSDAASAHRLTGRRRHPLRAIFATHHVGNRSGHAKNVLHENTANRYKSRLTLAYKRRQSKGAK